MHKILYTLSIALFSVFYSNAQTVTETEQTMSYGSQNGYTVEIDGADLDLTEKIFKKYMKDFGKISRNKKAKEYYAESIKIPIINGSENLGIYVKLDERVNMTTATVFADLGSGFVNSNDFPKESAGVETFVSDLYVAVKRAAIEEEMKDQEKEMKKLTKELEKLEKKNKDYHEDIADAKKDIEEAEIKIEQNLTDQDDQRVRIAKQKEMLDETISRLNNVGKN